MPRLTQDSNEIPIPIYLVFSGDGVTGVVKGDLTLTFFDAQGQVQVMDLTGATLAEVDPAAFPGRYLLRDYPVAADVDLNTQTYLTRYAGTVRLKWAQSIGVFDAGDVECDIDSIQGKVRDLWLLEYGSVVLDLDQSRLVIYDESDAPYKTIRLRDKDGGDVTIDGTGPAQHEAAAPYTP